MPLNNRQKIKAIDLFAGIGGMRIGFEEAGFEIIYSNDNDSYACETYRGNFKDVDERDIREVRSDWLPDFDVLLAGFPCQPFSMIGKRDGLNDSRGQLFYEIVRVLNDKSPKAFLLENVKHLMRHNNGATFEVIKNQLESAGNGYTVSYKILNSKNFGVPQNRERIYILGIKKPSSGFSFPDRKRYARHKNVKDILENDVPKRYYLSEKYYTGLLKHRKRHKNKGSGFGCSILDINGVSNTLVCGNMGRERNLIQGIPNNKNRWGIRTLTPRECARLQGFPDSFKIPVAPTHAYKQFGNAVTVPVIEEIANVLRRTLAAEESTSRYQASHIEDRSAVTYT